MPSGVCDSAVSVTVVAAAPGDVYSYPTVGADSGRSPPEVRRRSYGSNQDPASNGGTPPTGPAVGNGTAPPAEEHQLYQNYNQVRRRRSARATTR